MSTAFSAAAQTKENQPKQTLSSPLVAEKQAALEQAERERSIKNGRLLTPEQRVSLFRQTLQKQGNYGETIRIYDGTLGKCGLHYDGMLKIWYVEYLSRKNQNRFKHDVYYSAKYDKDGKLEYLEAAHINAKGSFIGKIDMVESNLWAEKLLDSFIKQGAKQSR